MNYRSNRVNDRARRAGFTLIELLTVIAIIAVLASISVVGIARYLEKAKIVQTESNMKTIGNALAEYSARTDNIQGYPTAYGYVKSEFRTEDPTTFVDDTFYELRPYTFVVGLHSDNATHQVTRFATNYDMNLDGALSIFEYLPVGEKIPGTNEILFSTDRYLDMGDTPMSGSVNEVSLQLSGEVTHPYVYIPFNKRQLLTARKYWYGAGEVVEPVGGASFDTGVGSDLEGRMLFPPAQYDGFVLIGAGPGGDDGGLTAIEAPGTPGTDYDEAYLYHVVGLRIAFLATLDTNDDKKLDFDFRSRTGATDVIPTPNGQNGFGAFIYVVNGP